MMYRLGRREGWVGALNEVRTRQARVEVARAQLREQERAAFAEALYAWRMLVIARYPAARAAVAAFLEGLPPEMRQ